MNCHIADIELLSAGLMHHFHLLCDTNAFVQSRQTLVYKRLKGQGISEVRHPDANMVRTKCWKYNYSPEGYAALYDLQGDPQEIHNLGGQPGFEDTEYEMKTHLLHWLTTADEADQIAPRWRRP